MIPTDTVSVEQSGDHAIKHPALRLKTGSEKQSSYQI
jgi:hypothetical protein